jgi:heat shock protein HtpX
LLPQLPSRILNAFAVSAPKQSAIALTDGLIRQLSDRELVGQLLLILNLPLVLTGAAVINWWAILLLIFAPNLSALAQLALSRTREFDADLNAVRLTGDPQGLASALVKIEQLQGVWMERVLLPGRRVPEPSLLRTHPHTEDRINRLAALKRETTAFPTANSVSGLILQPVRRRRRRT